MMKYSVVKRVRRAKSLVVFALLFALSNPAYAEPSMGKTHHHVFWILTFGLLFNCRRVALVF
jgi:hypothetical protein